MIYLKVVIIMSFDGVFLHKLLPEFSKLKSGRITKIMESGDTDFIFTIRANHINYALMISLSSDFARIHLTTKSYDYPATPKSLTMFFRKHMEGYFIEDIKQHNNDRIITFQLAGYNEMKDYTHKYLICEIMGRYSNLILTDDTYQILEVLKKDGVTEFGRTMLPNAIYEYPKTEKRNPFTLTLDDTRNLQITSPKELCQKIEGISLAFAQYSFLENDYIKYFYSLLKQDIQPSIFSTTSEKKDFYYFPLTSSLLNTYSSLSELLDEYYYEADNQAKIKLKTNDLLTFVQKQINKNEKKITKLTKELMESSLAEDYKIKGDLLLSYPNLKAKESKVSVWNYYTNEPCVIDLDAKYDIITNSQKYYKKYQKAKTSIHYIEQQIQQAKSEIDYLTLLSFQLQNCSINDALEIRQELTDNKYLLQKQNQHNNKRKSKPNYSTYLLEDVELFVGKNNLQNEYITHKLAKSNTYWFHVQNGSGSHVVVNTEHLTESLIRTAANLAAYFSSLGQSSSVPVDYTQVKNIKKIPGKRACFVTYTKQKTIYIDPDKTILESLRIKK